MINIRMGDKQGNAHVCWSPLGHVGSFYKNPFHCESLAVQKKKRKKRNVSTQICACCLADSDGCVCGSSHLLNITLTMHRFLIPSSDLLDKLIVLYPSAQNNNNSSLEDFVKKKGKEEKKEKKKKTGSDRRLCCVLLFLLLSTATGSQAPAWLTKQPVAVSEKCDRRMEECTVFYISWCKFPSLLDTYKYISATSRLEKKVCVSCGVLRPGC